MLNPMVYLGLYRIYFKQKEYAQALTIADKLKSLTPDNPTSYLLRADLLRKKFPEMFPEAVLEFINKFPHNSIGVAGMVVGNIEDSSIIGPFDMREEVKFYHYTKLEAVKAILETGKLRLTRVDFLNDRSERRYFSKTLTRLIKLVRRDSEVADYRKDFIQDLTIVNSLFETVCDNTYRYDEISEEESSWDELIKAISPGISQNDYLEIADNAVKEGIEKYYVLSLTDTKDKLTMWSMYSNFDGYNMEFDAKKLISLFNNLRNIAGNPLGNYVCLPVKVVYSNDKVYPLVKHLYNQYFRKISSLKTRYAVMLSVSIVLSVFVKMSVFSEERERRIVLAKQYFGPNYSQNEYEEVNFQIRNGHLYPFLEVPIFNPLNTIDCPIQALTVGPNIKKESAIPGLVWFKKKHRLDHVRIDESKIPLR